MDSQTPNALVKKRATLKARMAHIKKHIDSFLGSVDMHDVNVRLQSLEKAWEEYNAVQDQLEYNDDDDDDETQQHELDREAVTETYCELRVRTNGKISEDRQSRDFSQQNQRRLEQCMKMAVI